MLIVAYQPTRRVGGQSGLSGSREPEENRSVPVPAGVRRTVHAEDILLREEEVQDREDRLLDLARVARPPDDDEVARADLLTGALYCLTTPSGGSGAEVNALVELVKMLGAHLFFIDATEHDGLQAGIEGLLDLLSIALLQATVDTPGWQEMRKFAGPRFAAVTELADDAHERHAAVFLNRENVLSRLNLLLSELVRLRDLLTQDDAEPLKAAFVTATESRARWVQEWERGLWGQEGVVSMEEVPSAGEQVKQLFFGKRPARRNEGADHSRKR